MNDYLLSLVLGIVEGLTEFLPVSSTAHLRLSEALLHISLSDGYWKMYSIVIQLGAIACLPVYFRDRIAKLLSTFPRGERGDRTALTHPLGLVTIAFVVTAIPSFLLTKIIGKHLENLYIIGWSLLIGGVVMWIVDAMNEKSEAAGPSAGGGRIHTWKMESMSLGQGGKGENPIGVSQIDAHGWIVLAIGFVVSFVVAYASVAWFMAYVRKRGFVPFAVYRIVVGALVLAFAARLAG